MSEGLPNRRVTLRDIAKAVGVSHVTVSRALHDDPEFPLARRRQIQEVARQLGYQPDAMAVALGKRRHASKEKPIAAGVAWLNYWADPRQLRGYREFDLYWQGAHEVAEHSGFHLEEFVGRGLTAARLERILTARNILGVLIPPHKAADLPPDWDRFAWDRFSAVRFGYSVQTPPVTLVSGDHLGSGRLTFDRMRQLGYRRIGFVWAHAVNNLTVSGFLMQQANVPAAERVPVLLLPESRERWPALLRTWLKRHRPDALFTDASGLRDMLERLGLQVPRDLGLAANSMLDGDSNAGLDHNSREIGRTAMETLISLIQHHYLGVPSIRRGVWVQAQWIDGSMLPPKRSRRR